jgi:ubiquinone/menaquinone biosynthesis C-methylase UbiE
MANPASLPQASQEGFANASSYDKHRPSYPDESVQQLLTGLKISGQHGAKVVDLAAGTGKFTELLAKRGEAYDIVAIEPHDGMRGELERKNLPNVKTKKGSAAEIPLESRSVDALIAAQVSAVLGWSGCL